MTTDNFPLLSQLGAYVNGHFRCTGEGSLTVCDPSTTEVIARLPSFGALATQDAIAAAATALQAVPSVEQRTAWLEALVIAHADHREELARIITLENGKPIAEARGEVDYAAGFYREAALRIAELAPKTLERTPRDHRWTVYSRPAGVVALITPWNFPLSMLAKKVAGALAAGAPFVVKPAETTPLSAIALFAILHKLSLPAGQANLVFGDAPAIGKVLCEHPEVRVISFTGSTAVGKLLSAQSAPFVKRMGLELGGNAPFIVFEDADLEHATEQLMQNKFRSSGQTCVCTNRVYVHASVADDFVVLLADRIRALKLGSGMDPTTTLGPLINRNGFAKVQTLVSAAISEGATLVEGHTSEVPAEGRGMFYPPTLLDDVRPHMRCVKEELFGPVLAVLRFDSEQEVLRAANDTEYGLAAYVFSADQARCQRVIAGLRFGHVAINSGSGPTPEAPFGGMKQSGLGREGGVEGLLEFTELQTVATPIR